MTYSIYLKKDSAISIHTWLLITGLSLTSVSPVVHGIDINKSEAFFEKVKLSGWISQGAQAIEADDGAFDPDDSDMSPGFNRFRFALGFDIALAENIDAYVEFSEEPNDFGVDFTPHIDFAVVNFTLSDAFVFQMGTVGTGLFNFRGYSDGAAVQDNPLIGNSPADMAGAAEGIKLFGKHESIKWDITLSTSDFGESFGGDRGFTYIGKAALEITQQFKVGAGVSLSDHGDQVRNGADTVVRAGFYQGDGDNYRFPSAEAGSIRNTHMGLIPGLDTEVLHVDAHFQNDSLILNFWGGELTDDFSFGDASGQQTVASQNVSFIEVESKVSFLGLEGTFLLTPKWHIAGRYVSVTNESDGVSSEDEMARIQFGVGYKYLEHVMFKAEVVSQTEEENSAGQIGSDWSGLMLETSYTF